MKLSILDRVNRLRSEQKKNLKRKAIFILKTLDVSRNKELCVAFVDDEEMRKLNADYRNINRTTDVLSFPQDGPDDSMLGDVIISIDTAIRRSKLQKLNIEDEIHKLMIHGILHLLGYDHKKKNEARVMRKKELEILSSIESL
ncbi:MAG TPA: rRNA maturation RNase YbeY [Thermodesulfobacteriota bacterium]|jgi:rRNA maturation RNase YbeY